MFLGEVLSVNSRTVDEDDDVDLDENNEDELICRELEEKMYNAVSMHVNVKS